MRLLLDILSILGLLMLTLVTAALAVLSKISVLCAISFLVVCSVSEEEQWGIIEVLSSVGVVAVVIFGVLRNQRYDLGDIHWHNASWRKALPSFTVFALGLGLAVWNVWFSGFSSLLAPSLPPLIMGTINPIFLWLHPTKKQGAS